MSSTDTIPRLQHLVPHLGELLVGLEDKPTFEDARQRYIATTEKLEREGKGRRTVSRVGDRDAYWSPTQEVLDEAMRLGFVVRQPLPSARRYVDEYRQRPFQLTDDGYSAAGMARDDAAGFTTLVSGRAIARHPYLRGYLRALAEAPIICPVVSQGDIAQARRTGERGVTQALAAQAAATINGGPTGAICTADDIAAEMQAAARKRFGDPPANRPTDKAFAEAFNDAFATASVRARGLRLGAIDLRTIRAWTSQWLLTDQSRYVPGFASANVIWLAADFDALPDDAESPTGEADHGVTFSLVAALPATREQPATAATEVVARRRGVAEHGERVAAVIVEAYRSQAQAAESNLVAPYLAIHEVRAEAAFRCGVTRALVNMVIERLVDGAYPQLDIRVHLHLAGAPQPPPSEPVYDRGGSRRYAMTLTRRDA